MKFPLVKRTLHNQIATMLKQRLLKTQNHHNHQDRKENNFEAFPYQYMAVTVVLHLLPK